MDVFLSIKLFLSMRQSGQAGEGEWRIEMPSEENGKAEEHTVLMMSPKSLIKTVC